MFSDKADDNLSQGQWAHSGLSFWALQVGDKSWVDEIELSNCLLRFVFCVLDPFSACKLFFDSPVDVPLT